ncbi:MAG: acyl carrier protein [Steroidobacteraceae bacterium]|jgi:acyl carrier protein
MDTQTRLTRILRDTLMLETADRLTAQTRLLGAMPGFDSMAVVALLTALEEEFGITVEDDEMSADVFETLGSLEKFVNDKLA